MTYIQMLLIDLINDLQMPRKQFLQQLHRPALQGFREHSVVSVCKGLLGNLPRLRGRKGEAVSARTAAYRSTPILTQIRPQFHMIVTSQFLCYRIILVYGRNVWKLEEYRTMVLE